jgi:hypothetical protein
VATDPHHFVVVDAIVVTITWDVEGAFRATLGCGSVKSVRVDVVKADRGGV